jgi:hypothetical protein
MADPTKTFLPQLRFQVSLLKLTAAVAEVAGPTVSKGAANPWKEEARKVENLVEQYVRVRPYIA